MVQLLYLISSEQISKGTSIKVLQLWWRLWIRAANHEKDREKKIYGREKNIYGRQKKIYGGRKESQTANLLTSSRSTAGCSKYSIYKSIKPTITVIFFWVLLVPFCQSRVQNSFLDPFSFGCLWAHGFWPSHLKIIWYLIKIRSIPRLNKWRNDIYN